MKNIQNTEEKKLRASITKNQWIPVNKTDKEKYKAYAVNMHKKDKTISIRISSHSLNEIQKIADSEGIPYQTLITSVLHKYINSINANTYNGILIK